MKRLFALLLATACLFGLAACGGNTETPAGTTAQPTETTAPKVEKDDGVLRVLMIGHSLGNDAMWMQPAVFRNEAPDMKVVIGFLYYSGCKLSAHVEYAQQTAAVYGYMEYDSDKGDYWWQADSAGNMNAYQYGTTISGADPNSGRSQTSLFAIKRQDWDIVVTQGYPWEVAKVKSTSYDPDLLGNFNKLKQFVLDNDIDKETTPKFGWNMVWTFPDDDELIRANDRQTMNANFEKVEDYRLWTRLSECGQLCNLPEPLLYYRKHPGQVCATSSQAQYEGKLRLAAGLLPRVGISDEREQRIVADAFDGRITDREVYNSFASLAKRMCREVPPELDKAYLKTTLKSRLIDIALSQGFTAPVGTMGILGIKAWLYVNVRGKK